MVVSKHAIMKDKMVNVYMLLEVSAESVQFLEPRGSGSGDRGGRRSFGGNETKRTTQSV